MNPQQLLELVYGTESAEVGEKEVSLQINFRATWKPHYGDDRPFKEGRKDKCVCVCN
jgi:hypothetical protein